MPKFKCVKNEKGVYFLLTSTNILEVLHLIEIHRLLPDFLIDFRINIDNITFLSVCMPLQVQSEHKLLTAS